MGREMSRVIFIDWLRIFAVFLLFPFHTAMIFTGNTFYVQNHVVLPGAIISGIFINSFHMHTFMFLAGASSFYALSHRSWGSYIKERFFRIFIPLIFGILVIVSPQVYLRLSGNPDYNKSFFEFFPHFFNGIHPEGNFEWGHLWFLAYLFVFSLIALPVFNSLRNGKGRLLIEKLYIIAENKNKIFLLFIPISVIEVSLRWLFPDGNQNLYNDWANFLTYFLLYVYGYIIVSHERFSEAMKSLWKPALSLALIITIVKIYIYTGNFIKNNDYSFSNAALYAAVMILNSFSIWCWLIAFMGIGMKYLNRSNRVFRYLKEAAYPYYILHQTVIVFLGFYIVVMEIPDTLKFFYICLCAIVTTAIIYEIFIRHINPIRFLFGMRKRDD